MSATERPQSADGESDAVMSTDVRSSTEAPQGYVYEVKMEITHKDEKRKKVIGLYQDNLAPSQAVWDFSLTIWDLDEIMQRSYDFEEFIEDLEDGGDEQNAGWSINYKYGRASVRVKKVKIDTTQGNKEDCAASRLKFKEACESAI